LKVHLLCAPVIHGDSNLALGLALFGEIARCTLAEVRTARRSDTPQLITADRVALGRCRLRAPTDPYVLALEHTVPQIRVSLHADRASGPCGREPVGNDR
jgi:hypothetical protein